LQCTIHRNWNFPYFSDSGTPAIFTSIRLLTDDDIKIAGWKISKCLSAGSVPVFITAASDILEDWVKLLPFSEVLDWKLASLSLGSGVDKVGGH
jgi:hypothetical protein